jgi:hypothetical protein
MEVSHSQKKKRLLSHYSRSLTMSFCFDFLDDLQIRSAHRDLSRPVPVCAGKLRLDSWSSGVVSYAYVDLDYAQVALLNSIIDNYLLF